MYKTFNNVFFIPLGTRSELFKQYEGLCKRIIFLNNAKEDLSIKKNILEKERARCSNRSKFHNGGKIYFLSIYTTNTHFLRFLEFKIINACASIPFEI